MVVIDASLAVKLLVVEAFTAQARALALSWKTSEIALAGPNFMPSEVASAFRKKIQEGIFTNDGAKQAMTRFYGLRITLHPSRPLHDRAIDLAVELNQRLAYDCHYLALAEALNDDFWTADEPFYRVARGRYPRVKWIGNYNS